MIGGKQQNYLEEHTHVHAHTCTLSHILYITWKYLVRNALKTKNKKQISLVILQ